MMLLPSKNTRYPLSPLWWFWLPVAVAAGIAIINPFLADKEANLWAYGENGVLETVQSVVAFCAAGFGIACLRRCKGKPWLVAWVLTGVLGCLYIGLEEISYGQHIFKWKTPAYWQGVNDQKETNLHNTSHWLDQKLHLLFMTGIVTGGILIPLLRRLKPALLPARFNIIYPDDVLFWTAFWVVLTHATKLLHHLEILTVYNRASEVTELLMYYFVLLYFIMLRDRLKCD